MARVISAFDDDAAHDAARVADAGGTVIYPTETAYALGCSALDSKAARRVYELKRRELRKPLPVIMASKTMAAAYVELSREACILIDRFMPGPLTVIAAKKKGKRIFAGDASTLAFRISSSLFCREFSYILDAPIVSTSANISHTGPIYDVAELEREFGEVVDLIVSAGVLAPVPTSTMVDVTGKPKVVREGQITKQQVMKALKEAGKVAKKQNEKRSQVRKAGSAKKGR